MNKMTQVSVELLMTSGCHLCDDAKHEIAQFNQIMSEYNFAIDFVELDISVDEGLVLRFGDKIPVLRLIGAAEVLEWPFDSESIYRFLSSASS